MGGATLVGTRALIGRMFTTNQLLPTQSYIQFTSAAAVGTYFGFTSVEYYRSVFYFGWVSKNATTPQALSFSRWANVATAPQIFGVNVGSLGTTPADFIAISNGSFNLTVQGTTHLISGLDFTAAVTFADIALIIQNAVQALGGAQFTTATVVYDGTTQSFNFVGGDDTQVLAQISVSTAGSGTDISFLMGWQVVSVSAVWPNAPVFSAGILAETITETLTNSASSSNNFGSFLFLTSFNTSQVTEAATWNQGQNVQFMYCVPTSAANASAINTALLSIGGSAVTLAPLTTAYPAHTSTDEYPEQCPMMILAATNYTAVNSVQNYMFQQFSLTPSVTTDAAADLYDGLNTNYYGQTQESGSQIAFYQRGLMSGSSVVTNLLLMNVYADEQWLKAAMGAQIMSLLLALPRISANAQGTNQINAVLMSVINQAVNNGTISVAAMLNTNQIVFITEITNDPNAWRQVQTIGYWLNVVMVTIPDTMPIQYEAEYTLVYKKDDVVNKVVGSHILI